MRTEFGGNPVNELEFLRVNHQSLGERRKFRLPVDEGKVSQPVNLPTTHETSSSRLRGTHLSAKTFLSHDGHA